MKRFLVALVLVGFWLLLVGRVDPAEVLIGAGAAGFALWVIRFPGGRVHPPLRLGRFLRFVVVYLGTLIVATAVVATETWRLEPRRSGVLTAIPLPPDQDRWVIAVTALLITLLPGTTVVMVGKGAKWLYVHGIGHGEEEVRRQVEGLANAFRAVVG